MRNIVVLGVVLGLVGLVVGYLVFGRGLTGDLLPIKEVLGMDGSILGQVISEVRQVEDMRRNILFSGGGGLLLGVILGAILKR